MTDREILPLEYWHEFYTRSDVHPAELDRIKHSHLKMIEDVESGHSTLTKDWNINWLMVGIYFKREKFIKIFLECHNVPDTLTLKEQLAYMQLMGK